MSFPAVDGGDKKERVLLLLLVLHALITGLSKVNRCNTLAIMARGEPGEKYKDSTQHSYGSMSDSPHIGHWFEPVVLYRHHHRTQ